MKSLFEQPWLYAVIAFALGVVIGYVARGQRKATSDGQPSEVDTAEGLLSPAASQAAVEETGSQSPAAQSPAAESPAAETPAAETLVAEALVAEAPVDETPGDDTPTGRIPVADPVSSEEPSTAAEPVQQESAVAVLEAWTPGPYPNSALPAEDGAAPAEEFTIKAKADSKLFHTETSPYYRRVKPDVWFRTEAEATAAGFTGWVRRPKKAAQ